MLNSNIDKKLKISIIMLALLSYSSKSYAQFYDLNDNSKEIYSSSEKTAAESEIDYSNAPLFSEDTVEESPVLETSGDEGGFIPETNPDDMYAKAKEELYNQDSNIIPTAEGMEDFSATVAEEEIKEQLRDINQLDYIGFLDPNFDEGLWKGVSYQDAKDRFERLSKNKLGSMHVKRILRNMLVAKARPPKTPENQSWLVLRLKTLENMGNLSDVQILLKDVSVKEVLSLDNKELNRLYLESNLFNDKSNDLVKKLLATNSDDETNKIYFILNLYSSNKGDQAKLTFNALKEFNQDFAKSYFAKLFQAVLNSETKSLKDKKSLNILEQYAVSLKPELFTDVDYSKFKDRVLFKMIDNAESLSVKTKVAEALMQNYPYSYNADALYSVYNKYNFSSTALSVPLKFIKSSEDEFKNRALLYQSSKIAGLNSTKALALKKLWESYEQAKLNNIKLLITERTQNIALNTSIAWFSQDILNGQLLHANIEYSTLKVLYENIDQAYTNKKFLNMQIALEFLRRTSTVGMNFDSIQDYKETLNYWFESNKIDTVENYEYVLKVLTLLDSVQAEIPEDMWKNLYDKASVESVTAENNPIWLRLVGSSIQRGEKGKSLLYIIDTFESKTPKELDAQTLANVVSCLNFLNMPQEMSLIGMQAILDN